MPKIHPGHEVLSLFGMGHKTSVLQKAAEKSLLAAMVSAFFVVIVSALLLGISTRSLPFINSTTPTVKASSGTEAVAFQPGALVSSEITRGYLGAD